MVRRVEFERATRFTLTTLNAAFITIIAVDTRLNTHIGRGIPWPPRPKQNESFSAAVIRTVERRNRRTVWTVATKPWKGAHFATFPPRLIEPD